MSTPFVTVLIDTYNQQLFIEDAINSVLQQDLPSPETEILVVDDGSTDCTPDIVRKFAGRVRLLRKGNGGQASAFNMGIAQARGEIVAFLDGDDWWAPGKLVAVVEAFSSNPDVGLVGHGVIEVHLDGRQRTEAPREVSRFRLTSPQMAKMLCLHRCFLGTSRMAYRRGILSRIGTVPEALRFEADEYLFTLAGLFAEVMILREPLTFYRVHGANLFQLTSGDERSTRGKQRVLVALAQSLDEGMEQRGVPREIARTILDCIEVEAEVLQLRVDSGYPWETLSTELRIMRLFHSDASIWQHLFSCLRLIPAAVLPARTYYDWRHRLSLLTFYQEFRRHHMPFPVPRHVERQEKP